MYRKKLMRACLTGIMVVSITASNVAPVFAAEPAAETQQAAGKQWKFPVKLISLMKKRASTFSCLTKKTSQKCKISVDDFGLSIST